MQLSVSIDCPFLIATFSSVYMSYTKLCIIMKAILFFGQHKKKLHKGPFKDYSQQNCLVLNKRDVRLSQSNALLAQQSFSISDQNHNYL